MSTTAERRRQKANEKAKKRREEARKGRALRRERAPDLPEGLGELCPAFASSNWADQGVEVRAAIARPDPTGRLVAALLTANLATGALSAVIETRGAAAGWDARVSDHGGEMTMMEVDPALIARLVEQCRGLDASTQAAVQRLLAGVHATDHPHAFRLGLEPPPPPKVTWGERLAGLFRR